MPRKKQQQKIGGTEAPGASPSSPRAPQWFRGAPPAPPGRTTRATHRKNDNEKVGKVDDVENAPPRHGRAWRSAPRRRGRSRPRRREESSRLWFLWRKESFFAMFFQLFSSENNFHNAFFQLVSRPLPSKLSSTWPWSETLHWRATWSTPAWHTLHNRSH